MSKKCLVLISTLLAVVSMFSMVVYAAPQPKDMALYADFEDGKLDGWTLGKTVNVVDMPGGKGKCVLLDRTDADVATHTTETPADPTLIQKNFDKPLEGEVTVEFKMMTETNKQNKAIVLFNSDEGNEEGIPSTVLRAQFNAAKIRIVQPEGTTNADLIEKIDVNKWYHLKMVINTATGKADVYVDGNKLADQIVTENPPKNIAGIRANLTGKAVGKLYLDDIMVYQEGAATPKAEAPKAEAPKADAPKADAPKADAPKADAPKADAPKADAPKADAPKAAAPKADAPKADAPKAAAAKNPKTGDTGSILYGLLLVASVGTFVSTRRKAN